MKRNKEKVKLCVTAAVKEIKKCAVFKNGSNVVSLNVRLPLAFEGAEDSQPLADFYTAIAAELENGAKELVKKLSAGSAPVFITADYSAKTDGASTSVERRIKVKRQGKTFAEAVFSDTFRGHTL